MATNNVKDLLLKMKLEYYGPTGQMQQAITAVADVNYRRELQQKFNNMQAVNKMNVRLAAVATPPKPVAAKPPAAPADKSGQALQEIVEMLKYPDGDSPRHWHQIAAEMKNKKMCKRAFSDRLYKSWRKLETYRITS